VQRYKTTDRITAIGPFIVNPHQTLCPNCRGDSIRLLILLAREGYPPDDPRHNIGYTHDAIFFCESCAHGFAEERRHDCFDFEDVWDQDELFPISPEKIAALRARLPDCPDPASETCACALHKSLRGRWPKV
jgi:hypothetical protein